MSTSPTDEILDAVYGDEVETPAETLTPGQLAGRYWAEQTYAKIIEDLRDPWNITRLGLGIRHE